jgi:hypothetical protein
MAVARDAFFGRLMRIADKMLSKQTKKFPNFYLIPSASLSTVPGIAAGGPKML